MKARLQTARPRRTRFSHLFGSHQGIKRQNLHVERNQLPGHEPPYVSEAYQTHGLAPQMPAMLGSLLFPPSLSHSTILDRDSMNDRQEQPDGMVRYGVGERLGRVGDDYASLGRCCYWNVVGAATRAYDGAATRKQPQYLRFDPLAAEHPDEIRIAAIFLKFLLALTFVGDELDPGISQFLANPLGRRVPF